MQPFKRGDIVRQPVAGTVRYDYFHVEYAHPEGALDVIDDATGKPAGLSANAGGVEPATMAQLLEERERRAFQVSHLREEV
jgi:hypothetical protein